MGRKKHLSFTKTLRCRELREAANLTQAEAAQRLGVTRQTLNDYESGRIFPSVPVLSNMSDLYRAPLGAFISQ